MKRYIIQRSYWLIIVVFMLSALSLVKGCKDERNPVAPQSKGVDLSLSAPADPQAKAVGLTITAVGLGNNDKEIGPTIGPIVIANPTYPLTIPLTFRMPPCRYRVTIRSTLSRGEIRTEQAIVNVCQQGRVDFHTQTYEEIRIDHNPIQAPESANAGETITVSCDTADVDAPDRDTVPVTATLTERDSGAVFTGSLATGAFSDPYPSSSIVTQRVFTCTIADGRSPDQTFESVVQRILPIPTPILLPPCLVTNLSDAAIPGSLRQRLLDVQNGVCASPITFAVSGTIWLSGAGPFTVPPIAVTIDGGGSVVLDGMSGTQVFVVTNSGTNLTLRGLTITNGLASGPGPCPVGCGGGMSITAGTVRMNSTLVNNSALSGGGLYIGGSGRVIINGTVTNNSATVGNGGGIYIDNGTLTINTSATVTLNTGLIGGGIYNSGGTVTIVSPGIAGSVSGNISGACPNYYIVGLPLPCQW